MKNLIALLLVVSSSSLFAQSLPKEPSVSLNVCQRKALAAAQIKANKKYETVVTLASMTNIKQEDVLDDKKYIVDLELGSASADVEYARYEVHVLADRTGSCLGPDTAQAKWLKKF